MELLDTYDSKSYDRKVMRVGLPPPAPLIYLLSVRLSAEANYMSIGGTPTGGTRYNDCFNKYRMPTAYTLKLTFWLLVVVAVMFEVVADILFKKWSMGNKNILLAIGLTIYIVGTIFWAVSLKYEYLSKAIAVFTILNLIILVLAGIILFKENLSLVNKIGIILGILSIILIEL